MEKNSTLNYFSSIYHNEKVSLGKLDFTGKRLEVNNDRKEKEVFMPSVKAVNTILSFAKSYEVLHSKATGCIEMSKN